jgi:hypothetical protein
LNPVCYDIIISYMATQIFTASPAGFNIDSKPYTIEEARAENAAFWCTSTPILSDMVSVGAVPESQGIRSLLGHRDIISRTYSEYDYLTEPSMLESMEAFQEIVQADCARGKLLGPCNWGVDVGNFGEAFDSQPWHHDGYTHLSVRWLMARGVGSVRGARGQSKYSDFDKDSNNLLDHLRPQTNSRLTTLLFPEGEVLRFANTGHIHAGPLGDGVRMLMSATVDLRLAC